LRHSVTVLLTSCIAVGLLVIPQRLSSALEAVFKSNIF